MEIKWDGSVPGLGVKANKRGSVWILKYRSKNKQVLTTIGPSDLISAEEARAMARRLRWEAKQGRGPDPRKRCINKTLDQFSEVYLARHARPRKKSWKKDESRLRVYVSPLWGRRQLRDISRADVAVLHAELGQRVPTTANRVLELLQKMFTLAEKWGYLPEGSPNPAEGHERFPENRRTRWLTDEEISRVAPHIEALSAERSVYFWFLLLTGMRKTEVLMLKWSNLDLSRGTVLIGQTKNGEPHFLPLSSFLVERLQGIQRISDWVFPGRFPNTHWKRPDKVWWKVRALAGLDDVSIHALRHTCASRLVMNRHTLKTVSEILNHKTLASTNRYAHLAREHLRETLEDHSAGITSLLDPAS